MLATILVTVIKVMFRYISCSLFCSNSLNPSWCLWALLDHICLTEHTEKMGSLAQCPITFVFLHRSFPHFVFRQTIQKVIIYYQEICFAKEIN